MVVIMFVFYFYYIMLHKTQSSHVKGKSTGNIYNIILKYCIFIHIALIKIDYKGIC